MLQGVRQRFVGLAAVLAVLAGSPVVGAEAVLDLGAGAKANDAVRRGILSGKRLPQSAFDVRQRLLKDLQGELKTHILANRGHENPGAGSFTFFETYSGPLTEDNKGARVEEGELFFGFFSAAEGGTLTVLDSYTKGSLLMELIAWDYDKKVFNFYQLVGNGTGATWRYHGDSHGILADVADINLGHARPRFGTRVQCAACHTLGGPVMKELEAPHTDWFTDRHKLDLGPVKLAPGKDLSDPRHLAASLFRNATDASHFSRLVKRGIDRLLDERARRKGDGQNLRQQLRSLFTTMEMNLVTDGVPFQQRWSDGTAVEIPADFFVDTRLVGKQRGVAVDLAQYKTILGKVEARFAAGEARRLVETRHAFSVPARSYIDNRVIDSLLRQGLLDEGLVLAALAVDFTMPVYSPARAGLLKYVPERARNAKELRAKLVAALKAAPADDGPAQALLANLTDPRHSAAALRQAARDYLEICRKARTSELAVLDWWRIASQRRLEIREAQTSKHPRGEIVEPGFKLLFPTDNLRSKAGRLRLAPRSGRCSLGVEDH